MALASDLRQAVKRLLRSPLYAAIVAVTLTLGAGSVAAMSAVMDALLFRPPSAVSDPDTVVRVWFRFGTPPESGTTDRSHYQSFLALKNAGFFAGVAAFASTQVSIGAGRDAVLVRAMLVSDGFFDVLGPSARAGAFPVADPRVPDGGDHVVISSAFWRHWFAEDPRALGAPLIVDGRTYVVAAVAPANLRALAVGPPDLWLPLDHGEAARAFRPGWRSSRRGSSLGIVARLSERETAGTAEARASATLRQAAAPDDDDDPTGAMLTPIVPGRGSHRSRESTVSLWLAGLSAFVLLIACANLSNLVMTRTLAHRREYFIRLALGASPATLVRQAFLDSAILIGPGAVGALYMSYLVRNAVAGFLPGDIPVALNFWDSRSALLVAASIATAFILVVFGSLWQIRRITGAAAILAGGSSVWGVSQRARQCLLAVQGGLCLALIVVAGLFVSSVRSVKALELGVDLDRTLQLTLTLPAGHNQPGEARLLLEEALEVFASVPDVESAALAERSPFLAGSAAGPRRGGPEGTSGATGAGLIAYVSAVGPGFFSTVGATDAFRGRDFTAADRRGGELVAIINAPLAQRLWPDVNPIGDCMWLDHEPRCYRVVGVIGGAWKFSILRREELAVYLPFAQVPSASPGILYLRSKGPAAGFVARARAIAQSLRPDLPAARVVRLRDVVSPEFRPWQLGAAIFGLFATIASVLAGIGLYGMVAVTVQLRLKEIGVRVALGASRRHVVRVVLGEGLAAIAAGVVLGGLVVAIASRWLSAVLYGVTPADPGVLARSALALLALTAVAIVAPTQRALRANPLIVLRRE